MLQLNHRFSLFIPHFKPNGEKISLESKVGMIADISEEMTEMFGVFEARKADFLIHGDSCSYTEIKAYCDEIRYSRCEGRVYQLAREIKKKLNQRASLMKIDDELIII